MSYSPVNWTGSTPLDAANLGTMDDGIDDAHDRVDGVEGDVSSHVGDDDRHNNVGGFTTSSSAAAFPLGVTVFSSDAVGSASNAGVVTCTKVADNRATQIFGECFSGGGQLWGRTASGASGLTWNSWRRLDN